jgi:hypothetical protein
MRQPAGRYTEADLERIIARTPEAQQKAIESDWKQLQAWLHRKVRSAR